jgi:integrase
MPFGVAAYAFAVVACPACNAEIERHVTSVRWTSCVELIDLRLDDIDWRAGTIRIRRLKGSHDGVHILERDEAAGLRRLQREHVQRPRFAKQRTCTNNPT